MRWLIRAISSGSTVCHSVFDFTVKPLFKTVVRSKFKDGRVHFRNSGMKGLNLIFFSFFVYISGYNDMKSALSEYLKHFAENGKVVREEDIREFFTQMQARKRQRTDNIPGHFCR